jgi:hypothetical protein
MTKPLSKIEVQSWKGIISDADTLDIPSGAAQTAENVSTLVIGTLKGRDGIREVTFGSTAAATTGTNHVIGITTYVHPHSDMIVFQLDDGSVRVGRDVGVIT